MSSHVTYEKKITDMSVYGIKDEYRWDGSVVIKRNDGGISVSGKYFPTKEEAETYAEKLLNELKGEE